MCWFIYDLTEPTFWSAKFDPCIYVKVLHFILKSPSTTIKCELDSAGVSKVSLNLSVNNNKFTYFRADL